MSDTPDISVAAQMASSSDRAAVVAALRGMAPLLRARGIRSLALFGSFARDEGDAQSDIDLLFTEDPARPLSLLDRIALADELAAAFGRQVDLVRPENLRPGTRVSAERDLVQVL